MAIALYAACPDAAPASWNRHVANLRSFARFGLRQGWLDHDPTTVLEARRVPEDNSRALDRDDLDRLFARREASVRDRCLWRMLYETAARANEVLSRNSEGLDLTARRAVTTSKGGNNDVIHWASGTARLLPKITQGRTRGPVFPSDRAPVPLRAPALTDLDPASGGARLSYRRAAEIFSAASGGATLHHLRHSALTHLAEDGVPTRPTHGPVPPQQPAHPPALRQAQRGSSRPPHGEHDGAAAGDPPNPIRAEFTECWQASPLP